MEVLLWEKWGLGGNCDLMKLLQVTGTTFSNSFVWTKWVINDESWTKTKTGSETFTRKRYSKD